VGRMRRVGSKEREGERVSLEGIVVGRKEGKSSSEEAEERNYGEVSDCEIYICAIHRCRRLGSRLLSI